MKFQCDRCKTRYAIADEKVRGKVLKVRCKSCEAIITVRDQTGSSEPPRLQAEPASGSPPRALVSAAGGKRVIRAATNTIELSASNPALVAASLPPEGEAERPSPVLAEWYLSVGGKQEGPFGAEEAQRRVAAKAPGQEMFAWRDDFDDWLPIEDVPVLAVHLPREPLPRGSGVHALPVAPPAEDPDAPAGSDPGAPGDAATTSSEDNFEFNIGEASRLVKLPILPPPQPAAPRAGESLPGVSGPAPVADGAGGSGSSLPIASLSTEAVAVAPALTPPPERAPAASGSLSRPRRRLAIPIVLAGAATVGVVTLVGVFYGGDGEQAVKPVAAEARDSVLVTNFYNKDNPLFAQERRDPEAADRAGPSEPSSEADVDPDPADRADERPRTRGAGPRRTAAVLPEGNVKVAPVTRPEPPSVGAAPGKQDSFEGGLPDGGPLTPDDVRKTYAANEVGLKRCYERALKSDPSTDVSKMVVKITINPEGNVSEIHVPERPTDLAACVETSIKNWRFRRSTMEFTTEFTVFFAKRG